MAEFPPWLTSICDHSRIACTRFFGKANLMRLRRWRSVWCCCLGLLLLFAPVAQAQFVTIIYYQAPPTNTSIFPPPPPTFNLSIFVEAVTDEYGHTPPAGDLLSITNVAGSLAFSPVYQSTSAAIYEVSLPNLPPDVLTADFTLTWTNYSTNLSLGTAVLVLYPTNQVALIGQTVSLSALAWHTSGYQWQHNGTNLVEDAHFLGVTNATLTIAGALADDAGDYTVVANSPNHAASDTVSLVVVPRPLVLALQSTPGGWQLTVAHADGSPLDPSEIPSLQLYSTTNLALPFANWNWEPAPGSLINGMLRLAYADDGSPEKYWRAQQP